MEKWAKVSIGRPFQGRPGLMTIELPTGLGQVYRENQYVSDVSYRFDVREEAGELIRIWGYVKIVGGIQDQFGYGDEFTLRLDNGRPIEIVIKTLNFNSGEYLFADKSSTALADLFMKLLYQDTGAPPYAKLGLRNAMSAPSPVTQNIVDGKANPISVVF
jgi:hypothetical protein